MGRTFGYPIFKTESLDEMPFEQYRVLVVLLNEIHKEQREAEKELEKESMPSYSNGGSVQFRKKKGTTMRIINEEE